MELRATREMRRNEQLDKVLSKQAESPSAPAKTQTQPAPRQASDRCTLSQQALQYLNEQNRMMQELAERNAKHSTDGSGKNSELDLLSKQVDMQEKCLKIAASIMKGNRVPPEDLKYLMDNDPAGYKLAMAMRREKKDPEDCESVLDEEDQNGAVAEAGSSKERVSIESSGASSGGNAAPAQE